MTHFGPPSYYQVIHDQLLWETTDGDVTCHTLMEDSLVKAVLWGCVMIHFGPRHNYYYTMYDQLLWETINVVCHAHDEARVLLIDDSTPVSQSRHTLWFQPIACRSIMRCPRVLTRPEMVWQAFVPDIASGQLAVFDMAEKNPGKRNCCYGQCKSDERYPVKCAGVTF